MSGPLDMTLKERAQVHFYMMGAMRGRGAWLPEDAEHCWEHDSKQSFNAPAFKVLGAEEAYCWYRHGIEDNQQGRIS